MKVVAFIQARVSSSRLPGKVLADLGGVPMILYMVNRVRRARSVDQIVVVTSVDVSDDPLVSVLAAAGVEYFRGALDDVLDRFVGAADVYRPHIIVRLTGDCPLIDPALVDDVVRTLRDTGADYVTNADPPTYPDGMDVEAFDAERLREAASLAVSPSEREHVTLYMRRPDVDYVRVCVGGPLDASQLRLTVDYPDDLAAVRAIVDAFAGRPDFDLYDIYRCIHANRALSGINPHLRNEGLAKSLAAESGGQV